MKQKAGCFALVEHLVLLDTSQCFFVTIPIITLSLTNHTPPSALHSLENIKYIKGAERLIILSFCLFPSLLFKHLFFWSSRKPSLKACGQKEIVAKKSKIIERRLWFSESLLSLDVIHCDVQEEIQEAWVYSQVSFGQENQSQIKCIHAHTYRQM